MKGYTLIEATSEDLKELYSTSGFTVEGDFYCEKEGLEILLKFIGGYIKPEVEQLKVYRISGKLMNDYYGLTENPYPNGVSLTSIPMNQFYDIHALAVVALRLGARWFDEIVDHSK